MKKHLKSIFNYSKYISSVLLAKKTTYFFMVIPFAIVVLFASIPHMVNIQQAEQLKILIAAPVVFALLVIVVHSVYTSITIFRDTESYGLDLMVASKPIQKVDILVAKMIYLIVYAFLQAIPILIAFTIPTPLTREFLGDSFTNALLFGSMFVSFFAFLLFGFITALLAKSVNRALAYTFSILIFLPLLIAGNFSIFASNEVMPVALNQIQYEVSGVSVVGVGGGKDAVYLIPSENSQIAVEDADGNRTYQDATTSEVLSKIKATYDYVKGAATPTQIVAWADVPYQLGILFSQGGDDLFGFKYQGNNFYGVNVFNYSDNYSLNARYRVLTNEGITTTLDNKALVPRIMANSSSDSSDQIYYILNDTNNVTWDSGMEENGGYASSVSTTLINSLDNSASLIALLKTFNTNQSSISNLTKEQYLENFASYIPTILANANFLKTLTEESISTENIENNVNMQIALSVANLNYLFFSNQFSTLLKMIIPTSTTDQQYTVSAKYDGTTYNYTLGGFSSASADANADEGVTITSIASDNNYVYTTLDNYLILEKVGQVYPNWGIGIYWVVLLIIIGSAVVFVYYRKGQ